MSERGRRIVTHAGFCIDCNAPTVRAQRCKKCHAREYRQRPDVKAKRHEYKQLPRVKAKSHEYNTRPDIRKKMREYRRQSEVKEKHNKFNQEYQQRPHVKLRNRLQDAVRRTTTEYKKKQRLKNKRQHDREISAYAASAQKVLYAVLNGNPIPPPELSSRQRYKRRPEYKRKAAEYKRQDYVRERQNARERKRIATDPEYREKRNAKSRAWRRRKKALGINYNREWSAKRKALGLPATSTDYRKLKTL